MCECHNKKPYHRFTLFTQDADEVLYKENNIIHVF